MSAPLPPVFAPLTLPMSWMYGRAIATRNHRYDTGRGVGDVGRPVISIGNLSVGGSGKTPCVRYIAELLRADGHRPVIAMRGYGSGRRGESDEAAEYRDLLDGVPVVVHPNRLRALRAFLGEHPETDCVLLDDGFQHRRVSRDLDIVLVDATRRTLQDRLLPAGWLREPPHVLRRADAVVITRADAVDDTLAAGVERYHGRPPVAWTRHAWRRLHRYDGSAEPETLDVGWFRDRRVLGLFGIGNPEACLAQLRAAGANVVDTVPVRDHEKYRGRTLRRLRRAAAKGVDALVTTHKDWVKLRTRIDPADFPVPIVVPEMEIEIIAGADELARLVRGVMPGRS